MFAASDFLDLTRTVHRTLFEPADSEVWLALTKVEGYLRFALRPAVRGMVHPAALLGEDVFLDQDTIVEPGAVIKGPAWIGRGCQIRTGCYIRENVIVGDGCVLGNSCEFKNCVLFDGCEIPHFNYVGDAILGYKAHLGAGVILSNVRLDRKEVVVRDGEKRFKTGLRKFSAVVGDHAEIGCNSVISPGTLIGRRCIVYPLAHFSGVLPEATILKVRQEHEMAPRE